MCGVAYRKQRSTFFSKRGSARRPPPKLAHAPRLRSARSSAISLTNVTSSLVDEAELHARVEAAIAALPARLEPLDVILSVLLSLVPVFEENRSFSLHRPADD